MALTKIDDRGLKTPIDLLDNEKIRFGTGNDLEIYHNGSNSYITDSGTGALRINSSELRIINAAGNEDMIRCIENGAVELYYNNTKTFQTTAAGATFDTGSSSCVVKLTSNTDAETVLQGYNSDFYLKAPSSGDVITQVNGNEDAIKALANGSVELYFDNSKKFETTSTGFDGSGSSFNLQTSDSGSVNLRLQNSTTGTAAGDGFLVQLDSNEDAYLWHRENKDIVFGTNDSSRWKVDNDGHFIPEVNDNYDIGTTSKRVRNIYTNDLHLSNQGSSNDVDGSWGDWTIQEGESDLFLKNNRSGKKYKFNLTEVS